jgi:hypothetical protein
MGRSYTFRPIRALTRATQLQDPTRWPAGPACQSQAHALAILSSAAVWGPRARDRGRGPVLLPRGNHTRAAEYRDSWELWGRPDSPNGAVFDPALYPPCSPLNSVVRPSREANHRAPLCRRAIHWYAAVAILSPVTVEARNRVGELRRCAGNSPVCSPCGFDRRRDSEFLAEGCGRHCTVDRPRRCPLDWWVGLHDARLDPGDVLHNSRRGTGPCSVRPVVSGDGPPWSSGGATVDRWGIGGSATAVRCDLCGGDGLDRSNSRTAISGRPIRIWRAQLTLGDFESEPSIRDPMIMVAYRFELKLF